eukprot:TRINITY_DN51303_c0_g1_i1.p1 TRINITY_DN51303_c0_g1~~TRINITY_DN51303_c0_g1_i1.p1  ORF type:complete len:320 (+),score=49.98 TRINITY_DN51303_c0_g1_i1:100-960(+)
MLGPFQGPMIVKDILAEVEKKFSCTASGLSPTLMLGDAKLQQGCVVEESSSLTLVWKSALATSLETMEKCQAKQSYLRNHLAEIETLALELEGLQEQAIAGPYRHLDHDSLAACQQEDERAMQALVMIVTMIKSEVLDLKESQDLLQRHIPQARWQELLGKPRPDGTPSADADVVGAFNAVAGGVSLAWTDLMTAVEYTGWPAEDVLRMFEAADEDGNGFVTAKDVLRLMESWRSNTSSLNLIEAHVNQQTEDPHQPAASPQLTLVHQHMSKLKAMVTPNPKELSR